MIIVHRICKGCGRTFSQKWTAGGGVMSVKCTSCQTGDHAH